MKTIIIKSELEQFQEQYPELYQQVFDLGVASVQDYDYGDDPNDYPDDYPDEPHRKTPTDTSTRFLAKGTTDYIHLAALGLESEGYESGNRDWREFLEGYDHWKWPMYIAWNPTHKLFAVESSSSTLDEIYPHLVGATEEGYTPSFDFDEDSPF